ncbi:MAG: hypothetical protein COA73_01200 [Candidatus Hydrogenedentota bacterium]|nr:MAG: hypothetical protein COA73_01200 [Candidatus Hydrogenedentota bacterium]
MEASTYILTADVMGKLGLSSGLLVPAAIFLLAIFCSGSILVATRIRQTRFDMLLGKDVSQQEKDRETLGKIFWQLDEPITPENVEEVFTTIFHYSWTMTHEDFIEVCVKIRDFDRDLLTNFEKSHSFLLDIRNDAKHLLGH